MMAKLRKNYLVTKQNKLNEMRSKDMTLMELRFFCAYLSKINPRDKGTRAVRFPVAEFEALLKLDSHLKRDDLLRSGEMLLKRVINIPKRNGGFDAFQIFKKCTLDQDTDGEWYIEMDANDSAEPLLFEFQDRFFSYQLWNTARLRSPNQIRMYEILKQYETLGVRILQIDDLKELLGLDKNDYLRFANFKKDVLDVCQQALRETTDIKYTYEPFGKRGQAGKILALKFTIEKNDEYVGQMTVEEFVGSLDEAPPAPMPELPDEDGGPDGNEWSPAFRAKMDFLAGACFQEFTFQEMVVLWDTMRERLPRELTREDIRCYDYLNDKYNEMRMRDERAPVKYRHAYLRSIIGKDYDPR